MLKLTPSCWDCSRGWRVTAGFPLSLPLAFSLSSFKMMVGATFSSLPFFWPSSWGKFEAFFQDLDMASCTCPFVLICRLFSLWGSDINSCKRRLTTAGAVLTGQDKTLREWAHVDTACCLLCERVSILADWKASAPVSRISPKSNDYMCATKTHCRSPPPPSRWRCGSIQHCDPNPCSVHGSSAAARLCGRPRSDTSRPAFHYSFFSFPARDSFLSGSHLECTECLFPAGRCKRGLSEQQGRRRGGYGNLANRAERKGGRLDTNCSRWSESRRVFVDRGGPFRHGEITAQPNAWRTSSLHVVQEEETPSIAVFMKSSPDWLVTHLAWSVGLFCDRLERDE